MGGEGFWTAAHNMQVLRVQATAPYLKAKILTLQDPSLVELSELTASGFTDQKIFIKLYICWQKYKFGIDNSNARNIGIM